MGEEDAAVMRDGAMGEEDAAVMRDGAMGEEDAAVMRDGAMGEEDAAVMRDGAMGELDADVPACPSGSYANAEDPAVCLPWTTCVAGTFVTREGSATADRVCGACTGIANCAGGVRCTDATDEVCGTCAAGYTLSPDGRLCLAPSPWSRQFGTAAADVGESVAVDESGDVYVAGYTGGGLEGDSAGGWDAFVRKYNALGMMLWTRQFGTTVTDRARSIAVDSSGNIYIVGSTQGALGGASAGGADAFVRKYDATGSVLWTRQFGTAMSDYARSVVVAGDGQVYVVGYTLGALDGSLEGDWDVFVRKYDAAGSVLWTRQFGTPTSDYGFSAAVDRSGNVYVGGCTDGALGGMSAGAFDVFVRKYDATGSVLWTRQFGTTVDEWGFSLGVDDTDDVYVAGYTQRALEGTSAGDDDAFVRKYSGDGALGWTRQFGSAGVDRAQSLVIDEAGDIYVAGYTTGDLEGAGAGGHDIFVRKLTSRGTTLATQQQGSPAGDEAYGIALDGSGGAYVVGSTQGTWPGQSTAGGSDALLAHFSP